MGWFVSNKKKVSFCPNKCAKTGKKGKRTKGHYSAYVNEFVGMCVCVFVPLPSIVYCHPVPQKAELFWAWTPEEQLRNGIRQTQRQQRMLGKGYT